MRRSFQVLILSVVTVALIGCGPQVPAASSFTFPAVGTLMQGGHEEAIQPVLLPNQSGALVINQTGLQIQVVVSNTIAELPIGQDFLFMLPPSTYEFYIYEPNSSAYIHKETLESGKLRYLYITRVGSRGG